MTKSTFGRRLKILMVDRGMSASEIAERAQVSRQMISRYTNNLAIPNLSTAVRIAEALGVTVDDLADGELSQLLTT